MLRRATSGEKASALLAGFLVCFLAAEGAQEQATAPAQPAPPPVLENLGKPMVVPFRCSEEDIQWAGLRCTEADPCPIYLELSGVAFAGSQIVVSGNIHSAAVTLYSALLASDDAGRTWREPHERIRGAGLDRVQFADPETGWVTGEQLSPLPQDPFLLITSDGAKTWRQQAIFGESRIGSVEQIFFSDKSNGALVFDQGQATEAGRYQLYVSQDGGASWTIKEESEKPPQLKRPPAPAGWRVRADGSARAFVIERRSGEQWMRVAAFAVNVGSCR